MHKWTKIVNEEKCKRSEPVPASDKHHYTQHAPLTQIPKQCICTPLLRTVFTFIFISMIDILLQKPYIETDNHYQVNA